ncbi:MAG TPA: hypothetical protein VIV60_10490 [Polyangiaceae bacterium]
MKAWRKPREGYRLKLLLFLYASSIGLIWCIATPLYAALSNAAVFDTDVGLFRAGSEWLLVVLDAQRSCISALSAALLMLGSFAYAANTVLSTAAWILLHSKRLLAWPSIVDHFGDCIGKLVIIAVGTAGSVAVLLGCWYVVFGSIGAWLEPILGERGTDWVQLATFAIALCATAAIFIVADVTRAVVVTDRASTRFALSTALQICGRAWPKLGFDAAGRVLSVVALQASTAWAVTHFQWLSGTALTFFAAVVSVEASALLSIMLRVGWMAYLLREVQRFKRTVRR